MSRHDFVIHCWLIGPALDRITSQTPSLEISSYTSCKQCCCSAILRKSKLPQRLPAWIHQQGGGPRWICLHDGGQIITFSCSCCPPRAAEDMEGKSEISEARYTQAPDLLVPKASWTDSISINWRRRKMHASSDCCIYSRFVHFHARVSPQNSRMQAGRPEEHYLGATEAQLCRG